MNKNLLRLSTLILSVAFLSAGPSSVRAAVVYTNQHRSVSAQLLSGTTVVGQDFDETFALGTWNDQTQVAITSGRPSATQNSHIAPDKVDLSGVLSAANLAAGISASVESALHVDFTLTTQTPFWFVGITALDVDGSLSQVGGGISYPITTGTQSTSGFLPPGDFNLSVTYKLNTSINEFHAYQFDLFLPEPSSLVLSSISAIPFVKWRKRRA